MRHLCQMLLLALATTISAQTPVSQNLPYPRDRVWSTVLETLQAQGWTVDRADAQLGIVITASTQAPPSSRPPFRPSDTTVSNQNEYERFRQKKSGATFWTRAEESSLQLAYQAWQDSLRAEHAEYLARLTEQASTHQGAIPIGLAVLVRPEGTATSVIINVSVASSWSEFVTCSSNGKLESRIINEVRARLAGAQQP